MVKIHPNTLTEEATIFTQHIVGVGPTKAAIALYKKAIELQSTNMDIADEKLLAFIIKHPRTISYIDAGLAFVKPHSEVRHRLYLMFAILESLPEYVRFFLPVNRNAWYLVQIIGVGIQAMFRLIVGLVIVKVLVK